VVPIPRAGKNYATLFDFCANAPIVQQQEFELLVRENNKLLTRYRTVQRANLRLKKKLIDTELSSEEISDEWIDINE
jgi:hypothetical protein